MLVLIDLIYKPSHCVINQNLTEDWIEFNEGWFGVRILTTFVHSLNRIAVGPYFNPLWPWILLIVQEQEIWAFKIYHIIHW